MYKGIEENEVAHKIDENITYYSGQRYGYDGCYLIKAISLTNRSIVMEDFSDIEREIGTGILKEIQKRAIHTLDLDHRFYAIPIDEIIDVYDTYEHKDVK